VFDEKLEKISGTEVMDIAQNIINSAKGNKINTITGSLNIVSENFGEDCRTKQSILN
jgi:PmbA protein